MRIGSVVVSAVLVGGVGMFACASPDSSVTGPVVVSAPVSTETSTVASVRPARATALRRILCFGDSLTSGVTARALPDPLVVTSLTSVEGYVPKLARLLDAELAADVELVNSGIGGEATSRGLARLDTELLIYEPDLVLLLEGVVDINTDEEEPRFTQIRNNLAEMMRIVQRRGIQVIIGTVPPMNTDGFRAVGAPHVSRLNRIIRQEANRLQVPIAGHERAFGDDPGLMGPDGLHPNDNGYRVMAQTWFEVITTLRF